MNSENKKYILENIGKKSIKEIASALNLKEKAVKRFLENERGQKDREARKEITRESDIKPEAAVSPADIKTKLIVAAALFIIITFAFILRMAPSAGNKIEFTYDASFNYRMVEDIIKNGDVPRVDMLSTYPEGKKVREFYPIGFYQACVAFYKAINFFKSIPISDAILIFCALCSSLIVLPAYFISYELYRNRSVAILSAALAGMIPGLLGRSLCYYFRFENLAVPMLFISLLFFIKAYVSDELRKSIFCSTLSVLFMLISLYVWRLSLLFLTVYLFCFIYVAVRNRLSKRLCIIFVITFVVPFLFTRFVPGFGTKYTGGFTKAWLELAMERIKYIGAFPGVPFESVVAKTGDISKLGDFTRLYLNNVELEGVSLFGLFNPRVLSFSAVFIFVYLFGYFKNRTKRTGRDILFVFLMFFVIVTIIFSRNKMILGPLTALTFGESIGFMPKHRTKMYGVILGIIVLIFLKTGYDSCKIAGNKAGTKQDAYLTDVINFINEKVPAKAVILSYWGDGWPIQTYCKRATNTDGLFESPEIVKRIIEASKIYYDNSEGRLISFCKKYKITHILFLTDRKFDYSTYAGAPYYDYFEGGKPTALGNATVLYKLISDPRDLKSLIPIYRNKYYILYKLVDRHKTVERNG